MAFQSGTQVNAALGRTDYTPFLQGALQGAQSQARGGELIGQGLAGLGQQVGQGIEKYSEQKKKNAERDGRINATLGAIQANAKTLEKYGRKEEAETLRAAGANILQETDLNKRAAMSQGVLEAFLQGQQIESGARQRQLGEQAAQYLSTATKTGGRPFSAVVKDASGGYSAMNPEAEAAGQQQYLNQELIRSQIAKNLAPKIPDLSLPEQQLAALRRDFVTKNNRPPTDIEDVKMMEKVQSSALPQPPIGESEFSKISAQNLAKRADDAILQGTKAQIGLENTTNLKAAIAAGAEQGPGADVKILLMNAANVFLSPENKFDTTSSNISKLSFNELTLSTAEKIMKQGSITNSEREQAKDTSARITTEKDSALFYIAFKEASDKRKMMIAEKVNALQSEGVEDRKEYAKALDIKNYPPLDNPIYGDYGVKINALAAAAELAKRNPKKK
jgi:hypothetical protein